MHACMHAYIHTYILSSCYKLTYCLGNRNRRDLSKPWALSLGIRAEGCRGESHRGTKNFDV